MIEMCSMAASLFFFVTVFQGLRLVGVVGDFVGCKHLSGRG